MRTVWIKWIAWNRNVFDKLCTHAKLNLFEIELIIYLKVDLALNNQQRLICHKTQTTDQPTNQNISTDSIIRIVVYF